MAGKPGRTTCQLSTKRVDRDGRALGGVALALAVAIIAGCTGGGKGNGDGAADVGSAAGNGGKVAAFCADWWSGATKMRERWSTTANTDPVASLLLLVSAPSDLGVLFDRLKPSAPAEIKPDVEVLARHFHDTASSGASVVRDPLAFLVGGLTSGAAVSASFGRFDDYVQKNCPVPAELSAASMSTTSQACERVTSTKVDASSPPADLMRFLEDAEAASAAAAPPSRKLRSALRELDPSPRFGFEGLGRLRFKGFDLDSTFTGLLESAITACAKGGSGTTPSDLLESIAPRPGPKVSSTLYGRCKQLGLMAPHHQTFACDSHIEIVDLKTGLIDVTDLTPTTDQREDGRGGWNLQIVDHPASGLTEPTWSATLNYVDYIGRKPFRVNVVDRARGTKGTVRVAWADADRVAVVIESPIVDIPVLKVFKSDGSLILERPGTTDTAFGTSVPVDGPGLVFAGYRPSVIIDLTTGAVVGDAANSFYRPALTVCPDADYMELDEKWFKLSGAPLTVNPISGVPDRDRIVRDGYLATREGANVFFGLDGTRRWSIPETIVGAYSINVIFGWIVATNLSNQQLVVDPATGTEAAGLSADTAAFLKRLHAEKGPYDRDGIPALPSVKVVDHRADMVIEETNGTVAFHKLSALCGAPA